MDKPLGIIIGSTTPYNFQFISLKSENGTPIPIRRGQEPIQLPRGHDR